MRIGSILANAVALLFCLTVLALFVALVALVGFLGALVTGLAALVIAYNVELEDGSAVGSSWTPDLYASQRIERPKSPEEREARHAERVRNLAYLGIAKHVGAALTVIGALGFFFVQLQP